MASPIRANFEIIRLSIKQIHKDHIHRALDQRICQQKQTFIPSEPVENLEDQSDLQCRRLLDSMHNLKLKIS